jgi:hypothetical protein
MLPRYGNENIQEEYSINYREGGAYERYKSTEEGKGS